MRSTNTTSSSHMNTESEADRYAPALTASPSGTADREMRLFNLTEDEEEAFISGFTAAARAFWPEYDPETDSAGMRPFCRPWDTEPAVITFAPHDIPSAALAGRIWFACQYPRMRALYEAMEAQAVRLARQSAGRGRD